MPSDNRCGMPGCEKPLHERHSHPEATKPIRRRERIMSERLYTGFEEIDGVWTATRANLTREEADRAGCVVVPNDEAVLRRTPTSEGERDTTFDDGPHPGGRPRGHYVCWCGVVVHGTGVLYETNGDVHKCDYRAPTEDGSEGERTFRLRADDCHEDHSPAPPAEDEWEDPFLEDLPENRAAPPAGSIGGTQPDSYDIDAFPLADPLSGEEAARRARAALERIPEDMVDVDTAPPEGDSKAERLAAQIHQLSEETGRSVRDIVITALGYDPFPTTKEGEDHAED